MLSKALFYPGGAEKTEIIYTYIPELLSGWRDPRVARKLLDLACSGVRDVNVAAGEALHYDLDQDAAVYFADLIEKGCHWRDSLMARFILRHSHELGAVRSELLHGLAAHFDKRKPDGAELEDAIRAMAVVRRDVPGGKDDAGLNAWADADIVRISPILTAPHDDAGMNYTQISTAGLVGYLSREDLTQPEHALLRSMAFDQHDGLGAFETLIARQDPSDLPTIADVLADLPYLHWGNYTNDLKAVANHFGPAAIPMLQKIALHGKDLQVRIAAALELLKRGHTEANSVLAQATNSSYWRDQMDARAGLDDLLKQQISIGSLASLCRSSVVGDPCALRGVAIPFPMDPSQRH